ncbi:MAG: C10 family peptidase [Muribaculaceae bacterium]|nr:C10 family peptidase [Muribaculaceae bacterium]
MKKLASLILLTLGISASARQISPEEALTIASDFMNNVELQDVSHLSKALRPMHAPAADVNAASSPFYVFNRGESDGFVIISGDDRIKAILGYSSIGSFDFENCPPQLAELFNRFSNQLESQNLSNIRKPKKSGRFINTIGDANEWVLETAQWGQGYPFNMYAQEIDGEKCPAGCVATAMGIVMKYNNWPETGRGHHIWTTNGTQLEYNFNDISFDYSLMPDSFEAGTFDDRQAAEVAKLMQAAGAAVNMQYDPYGSGAMTCVVGHYMHEYFKYSPSCQFISAANFDDFTWLNMIEDQIMSNHPIIMSGVSEEAGGHAFVCDGFNNENQLHINWGWDGAANGFYDPILLGGFNYGIGMVINLFNDGCEKEYARCWNDYGYLWAVAGHGAGFNVSVKNIEKDCPFNAIVGQITFPNDFSGNVCLALVDKDENIIEVNETVGHWIEANSDWDNIGYTWVGHGAFPFVNVTFKTPVEPSMKVQAVAREDGGDWKLILGTIEAPSHIDVSDNIPLYSNIEWKINDPYGLTKIMYQNNNEQEVLFGDCCPFDIEVNGGVAYVLIDGEYRTNGSDFSSAAFNFDTTKDNYIIEIFANRYEDLLNKKVILENAGELSSLIPEDEQPLIYSLTIEGPMNGEDYSFITSNLYSLKHLDVRATRVVEGFYPDDYLPAEAGNPSMFDAIGASVWGLESINLPETLKGFCPYSLPHRCIEYLEIPSGVESYEWGAISGYAGMKLDFLKVNNPKPVEILENSGTLDLVDDGIYRNNTILYVPEGSKEAYKNSSSWRGYKDIRETNKDFSGKYVDYDGVRYLILDDTAIASNIYANSPYRNNYYTVPEFIEFEGQKYPVTGNCREFATKYLYLDNVTEFEFNTAYSRITAAVTPHLKANYSGGKPDDFFALMIPGATANHYDSSGCNIMEMWRYTIDKCHNLLYINPVSSCDIKEVTIGGEIANVVSDCLYSFSNTEDLDVVVKYSTFWNNHILETHYSPDFNVSLPSEDLSIPVEMVYISHSEVSLKKNETMKLDAYVIPVNATDKSIKWSTDNEMVASVDANGNVTAVSLGTATITAKNGDASASCLVTVEATLVESVSLTPDNWSGEEGKSFKIEVIVMPEEATDKTLLWTSSDEAVATVDVDGNVSVLSEGTCVITATAADGSGISAECIIAGVSGIERIFSAYEQFEIYGLNGILINKNADRDELKTLTPGIYMIRQGSKMKKLVIR